MLLRRQLKSKSGIVWQVFLQGATYKRNSVISNNNLVLKINNLVYYVCYRNCQAVLCCCACALFFRGFFLFFTFLCAIQGTVELAANEQMVHMVVQCPVQLRWLNRVSLSNLSRDIQCLFLQSLPLNGGEVVWVEGSSAQIKAGLLFLLNVHAT